MSRTPFASPLPATGGAPVDRTAPEDRTIGSRADVTTSSPARYAKQLISHLGRKLTFTGDATTSTATAAIGTATARIAVGNGVLTLWAVGDEASVARVEQVLGTHLERFAQREALTVRWVRTGRAAIPTHGASSISSGHAHQEVPSTTSFEPRSQEQS